MCRLSRSAPDGRPETGLGRGVRQDCLTFLRLDASGYVLFPSEAMALMRYLRNLSAGRLILWCYFVWYLVVLVRYFDPNPRLWLTSLGLSIIIGVALYISTAAAGKTAVNLDRWQIFRLFLMPFCVSSFAALVKGRGFVLVFSPNPMEVLSALFLCGALCVIVAAVKHWIP